MSDNMEKKQNLSDAFGTVEKLKEQLEQFDRLKETLDAKFYRVTVEVDVTKVDQLLEGILCAETIDRSIDIVIDRQMNI